MNRQRSALWVVVGVVVLAAVGLYIMKLRAEVAALKGDGPAETVARTDRPAATPAPTPAPAGPARAISDEQRKVMLEVLRAESNPARTVWFQVDERNVEAAAFQKQLAAIFREAEWKVEERGSGGLVFKPGIYLLVGEEDWPTYASSAYDAFDKAGIEVKAARGYRAYYEEQKREKPGWQGPALTPEQEYVVLVGPNPPAAPKS
jgi:hypothetical protein